MIEHILLCRKMLKLFRIFLNIHEFFNFFEVFRMKLFLYSELQSRGIHHKIRKKIPHRTVLVRSLGDVGEIGFTSKTVRISDFTWVKIA